MPETEWITRINLFSEQREIVRLVERLFALADTIEARYRKAVARVEKIEQAVLGREMRGGELG
jgi:type I restriction enzyme, S subunit